jgi:hypothetical protein
MVYHTAIWCQDGIEKMALSLHIDEWTAKNGQVLDATGDDGSDSGHTFSAPSISESSQPSTSGRSPDPAALAEASNSPYAPRVRHYASSRYVEEDELEEDGSG